MLPRFSTAFPGALMFFGGVMLGYWALSGWDLFGLGRQEGGNGRS